MRLEKFHCRDQYRSVEIGRLRLTRLNRLALPKEYALGGGAGFGLVRDGGEWLGSFEETPDDGGGKRHDEEAFCVPHVYDRWRQGPSGTLPRPTFDDKYSWQYRTIGLLADLTHEWRPVSSYTASTVREIARAQHAFSAKPPSSFRPLTTLCIQFRRPWLG